MRVIPRHEASRKSRRPTNPYCVCSAGSSSARHNALTMTTHPRNRNTLPPLWASARSIPVWALIVATLGSLAIHSAAAQSEPSTTGSGAVYVVPISGTIDLGLAPYLSRVLDEAEAEGAAAVLLQIDTPGGRLDAALQMRDALLGNRVPTIAFVDRT